MNSWDSLGLCLGYIGFTFDIPFVTCLSTAKISGKDFDFRCLRAGVAAATVGGSENSAGHVYRGGAATDRMADEAYKSLDGWTQVDFVSFRSIRFYTV